MTEMFLKIKSKLDMIVQIVNFYFHCFHFAIDFWCCMMVRLGVRIMWVEMLTKTTQKVILLDTTIPDKSTIWMTNMGVQVSKRLITDMAFLVANFCSIFFLLFMPLRCSFFFIL